MLWSVVLEKTLESPLNWKEIQPVNSKRNQSWIFIGRTDAETPILWPSDAKSWLIWKDPDAGKDWGQEEKGMTGWDGWMASSTQWTWVWVDSSSWWWTGRPGVLQSMGSQRVWHYGATGLNWTDSFALGLFNAIILSDSVSFYEICAFSILPFWLFRYILHFMVEYSFHNLLTL